MRHLWTLALAGLLTVACERQKSAPPAEPTSPTVAPGPTQERPPGSTGEESSLKKEAEEAAQATGQAVEQIGEATGQAVDEAGRKISLMTAQTKEEAVTRADQLSKWVDTQLSELDQMAQKAGTTMSEQWKTRRADLVQMKEKAATQVDQLKNASEDAWKDVARDTDKTFGEIGQSLSKARQDLQGSTKSP